MRERSWQGSPATAAARTQAAAGSTHQQVISRHMVPNRQPLPAGAAAGAAGHVPLHRLQLRLQAALGVGAQKAAQAGVLHEGGQ